MAKSQNLYRTRDVLFLMCLISGFSLFALFWFGQYPYHTLTGDDLYLVFSAKNGGYVSSFWEGLRQADLNQYRPVFASLVALLIQAFDTNFRAYFNFNLGLEIVNVCFLSFTVWYFFGKNWLPSITVGLLMLVSRFSYYFVLQVWGFMEGLALFFFIALIFTTLLAYRRRRPVAFALPLICYILLILTHERYLAVGGFLTFAILLAPETFYSKLQRSIWTSIPTCILVVNFLFKTFVLQIHFFQGTDSQAIKFDLGRFSNFMFEGFATLLGFNVGPLHLSGLSIRNEPWPGIGLGILLFLALLALAILYLKYLISLKGEKEFFIELRNIILFLALLVPLICVASITIRQEFRWLYSPYAWVLLGLAYVYRRISFRIKLLPILIMSLIIISACSVDYYYRGYLENTFFVRSLIIADAAKAQIIDPLGPEMPNREVYIVHEQDYSIKNFVFLDQTFFQVYGASSACNVTYVERAEQVKPLVKNRQKALVFLVRKKRIVDITKRVL